MTDERTAVVVRHIRTSDLERVADVLGRAFDDDPVINHIVKQDARRAQRVRLMMSIALKKLTFPFGETYVTEGFEGARSGILPAGGRTVC
ncbi:MAG: hypothetical protein EXR63_04730 [Dehalococcoidia bacterium]|nr:hypothetical protein [Dehalococcoidia bacterium]